MAPQNRRKAEIRFGLVLVVSTVMAFAIACGGTETVVETVVVERVITQAPERVVETVEVEVTAGPSDDAMMMDDEQIPRNRQLILLWGGSGGVGAAGRYTDHDIWNIYNPGTSSQNGTLIIFEPLAYYSAFNDTEYP